MARLMKYCPNYQCVAYGRVVYSQSTRCVFCRWDLKPPRMKSETVEEKPQATVPNQAEVGTAVIAPRAHRRSAHALRPTA